MAISFVAKGTFASGTTAAISPGVPAGIAANDLLLLFVNTANQAITAPSGWTQVANSPSGQGTAGAASAATAIQVFSKITTGSESAPSIPSSGLYRTAIMMAFRGVDTTTPVEVTAAAQQTTAATAWTLPGLTTLTKNSLIVLALGLDNNTASTAQLSGGSNANLTSLTERHDQTTTAGGGIGVYTGSKLTVGATGTTAITSATSTTASFLTLALKPAPNAKTATLTDDFTTLDTTTKWLNNGVAGSPGLSSGTVSINGNANFDSLDSQTFYDLTGSSAICMVASIGNPSASGYEWQFCLFETTRVTELLFRLGRGNRLQCTGREGSSTYVTYADIALDLTNHKWVRLRESGGTVFWDTSPDGATWTNVHSRTPFFTPDNVKFRLMCGDANWVTGNTVFVSTFDNVNITAINGSGSGATLSATAALAGGTATGGTDGFAAGASLAVPAALGAGTASGTLSPTASGAALAASAGLTPGAAAGTRAPTAAGAALAAPAALTPGTAVGGGAGTASGAALSAATLLTPGTADGQRQPTAAGAGLIAVAVLAGGGAGTDSAAVHGVAGDTVIDRLIPPHVAVEETGVVRRTI